MGSLHKILVPVDGSPPALAALEHAVALAIDCDATVDLLHVEAADTFQIGSTTPLSPEAREEAERALDAAATKAEARLGARVTRKTARGEPLRTILETANAGDYELVVMGTHGRGGRLHAMIGSVAEGVVRNAPCPVLTVRDAGGEYQSFAERRHGEPSIAEHAQHHRT